MNRRAVIEEWGNIFIAVGLSVITLFVFSIFVSSDTVKKEKDIVEKDAQLQRETTLINYLRTPIAKTDFVANKRLEKEIIFPPKKKELESILTEAVANNLTIADFFTRMSFNTGYRDLIALITKNDNEFSKHAITATPNPPHQKQVLILTAGRGCGESRRTSVAYLPYNETLVSISMVLCKGATT